MPRVVQSKKSQKVGHDLETEQQQQIMFTTETRRVVSFCWEKLQGNESLLRRNGSGEIFKIDGYVLYLSMLIYTFIKSVSKYISNTYLTVIKICAFYNIY